MSDATSSEPGAPALRGFVVAAAFVAVAIVALTARATVASNAEYRAGAAVEASDRESAATFYRHAAQWYAPLGLGASSEALDALVRIGDAERVDGDLEGALYAWRSARSAIFATRHLVMPHAERLPELHARIAEAMAAQQQAVDPSVAVDEQAAIFGAQLDAWPQRMPRRLPAFVGSLAFMGWIATLVLLAWRGITADGRLKPGPAIRWGGASLVLLASWLVLVRLA